MDLPYFPDFPDDDPIQQRAKKSRIRWTKEDDELFLDCWEAYKWELQKERRNFCILARMAKDMGGKFSPEEIKIKIKNFKQRYRKERNEIDPLNGSLTQWHHYSRVHKIIGSFIETNDTIEESDEVSLDSSSIAVKIEPARKTEALPLPARATISSQDDSSSSSLAASPLPKKRKTTSESNNLKIIQEQGKEFLALMRGTIASNKIVSEQIINLLNKQKETDQQMIQVLEKLVDKC